MSTRTECDTCREVIPNKPLITATEHDDGTVRDFCSAKCFVTWQDSTRPEPAPQPTTPPTT